MPYECQEHNYFESVRTRSKVNHILMHERKSADFDNMQKNLINNDSRKRRKMKIADDNNNKIMRNSMIDVSDADEYKVEDDSHTLDNIDDDENAIYPIDYNHNSAAFLNETNLEIHSIFKEERLKQSSMSKIIKWYNKYHPSK